MKALLAALLAAAGVAAAAPVAAPVAVPSLDPAGGSAVMLPAYWFPAPAAPQARVPAVVLLHGCGGLYDGHGRLAARYTAMAAHLNALGIGALVPDSLTPRGEKELCTQHPARRRVTMTERRRDALGALRWLATQPGVDPARLAMLGWSNGGSAVLAASNDRHPEVHAAQFKAALAVAYYPGCTAELQRGYAPAAPLLMLLGDADDWTPPGPCKALAAAAGGAVQWQAYAGAVHGFDGAGEVHLRRDVPGGAHPGHGVHVGGDPAARAAAALRLDEFLRAHWSLAP